MLPMVDILASSTVSTIIRNSHYLLTLQKILQLVPFSVSCRKYPVLDLFRSMPASQTNCDVKIDRRWRLLNVRFCNFSQMFIFFTFRFAIRFVSFAMFCSHRRFSTLTRMRVGCRRPTTFWKANISNSVTAVQQFGKSWKH